MMKWIVVFVTCWLCPVAVAAGIGFSVNFLNVGHHASRCVGTKTTDGKCCVTSCTPARLNGKLRCDYNVGRGNCEDSGAWDRLLVTFRKWNALPRKREDAKATGWTMISNDCEEQKSPFVGIRYRLNNEDTTILIYDIRGHIAGMQMSFKADNAYAERRENTHGLTYDDTTKMMYITAYFTDPSTICSKHGDELPENVTGDRLMFFNGIGDDGNDEYVTVPLTESGISGTKWVRGRCFVGMGQHYWYDISSGMDCDHLEPFFLFYDHNKELSGFGFFSDRDIRSGRVEHPPSKYVGLFFQSHTMPQCLPKLAYRATQHVFLRSIPLDTCKRRRNLHL